MPLLHNSPYLLLYHLFIFSLSPSLPLSFIKPKSIYWSFLVSPESYLKKKWRHSDCRNLSPFSTCLLVFVGSSSSPTWTTCVLVLCVCLPRVLALENFCILFQRTSTLQRFEEKPWSLVMWRLIICWCCCYVFARSVATHHWSKGWGWITSYVLKEFHICWCTYMKKFWCLLIIGKH